MTVLALVLSALGAACSLTAALWLMRRIRPERYADDGMLYPGQQTSTAVPRLVRDQDRVTGLVVAGGSLQLLGAVLAFAG